MFRGHSITGDGRGKKLGFPTLNIKLSLCDMGKIFSQHPEGGVFLVKTFFSGKSFSGLLHLGKRPTFDSEELRVEIFLLDFNPEISLHQNTQINFDIKTKLREVMKFESAEALVEQIKKDVKKARNFL